MESIGGGLHQRGGYYWKISKKKLVNVKKIFEVIYEFFKMCEISTTYNYINVWLNLWFQ